MNGERPLSASGAAIPSSRRAGRRQRPAAVETSAPARDLPGCDDEASPAPARAASGVITCSVLRARYARRIRSLEDEIARLTALAERDHLTGLLNRRGFERCLADEWRRALRHGSRLALALVDVDHFKTFNDTHGHPAGDEALRGVAACLRGALGRAADGAFRIGGEEFALLLPDTDLDGGALVAGRVRDALRSAALSRGRSPTGAVTVSIGVCSTIVREGGNALDLVSRADLALYEAKRSGRDRAVCDCRATSRGRDVPAADGRDLRGAFDRSA